VVGDGSQLRTGEAAARLNVGEQTIRDYLTQHLLRAVRTAGGHRRIDAASIDELAEVLRIQDDAEREAAKAALRERNRTATPR
jgi:excisionase family DNA binding protein